MIGGGIWMGIWIALGEASNPTLTTVADWLSPMAIGGWLLYAVLAVACAWLTYRLLRSRLGV
jgi:hypothetical protein